MDFNYSDRLPPIRSGNVLEGTVSEAKSVSSRTLPILILSGAFVLTAVILFFVLPRATAALSSDYARYSLGFADGYEAIADNLVSGRGYRFEPYASLIMMREPGYPLFLAGVFRLGGDRIEAARWANWLLSIGIAFALMHLAFLVTKDRVTTV